MRILIGLALIAGAAAAQPALEKTALEGQDSWRLANSQIELTVLVQGTSLAKVVLKSDPDKVNPMWHPNRPTGHFVCVDGFGPTSAEERAAGLEGHGEAHRQKFEVVASGARDKTAWLTMRAKLPIVEEIFTRTFRMVEGENVVYVESELENLLGFDRPVNWAEHATIGSPFLKPGATVVDLSGTRSRTRPYPKVDLGGGNTRRLMPGVDFTWPMAPGLDGSPVDVRTTPGTPHYIDHFVTLLDPGRELEWVTAINLEHKLIIGYVFKRSEYPWLQHWDNYPATGVMARGMEFSTQPFDVPRREVITGGNMFDTPVVRWLAAKSKITSRFLMFYARVPEGFTHTSDVRMEQGKIVIEDRAAGKSVTLEASLPL